MRWFRLLLLTLTLFATLLHADTQPKGDPEKPDAEPEPEIIPGKLKLTLDPGNHLNSIRRVLFTPDGKYLVSASTDQTIGIRDARTGERVRVLRPPGVSGGIVALSPDGQTLAVAFTYREEGKPSHVIGLMSLADGRMERVLRGHTDRVATLAFSPNGKRLVSSGQDRTLRLWNLEGNEPAPVIKTERVPISLVFSPNGNRLAEAVADHDTVSIRRFPGGKVIASLKGGKTPGWGGQEAVAWSRDGKTVATCTEVGVKIWDPDGKFRKLLTRDWGYTVSFSPDSNRLLIIGQSGNTDVCDIHSGKFERGLPASERGAFSPDGKLVLLAGKKDGLFDLHVWNTVTHKEVLAIPGHGFLGGQVVEAGWSADGKTISAALSSSGNRQTAGTFHLAQKHFVEPVPRPSLHGPVHKQGLLSLEDVISKQKQALIVRRINKFHAEMQAPERPRMGTFLGPDRVAGASSGSVAWIFDANTGKMLHQLHHGNRVQWIAGSPDGRYLLSAAQDHLVRIWNVKTGKLLLSFFAEGKPFPEWVVSTPEGYYDASAGGEKLMGWGIDNGIEHARTFQPAQRFRKHFYRPELIKQVLQQGNTEFLKTGAGQPQEVVEVLPPRATLRLAKQEGARIEVEVRAQASCKGQPVSELHLLIDGRPFKLEDGQAAVKSFATPVEKDAKAEWALTLEPGPHKLSVRATARDTYSISGEIAVEVAAPITAPRSNKQGTLYYVGVGVNEFQHHKELKLSGAVPDIENMARCLKETCAGRFVAYQPIVLTDARATREAILKTLTDLQGKLKPTDVVIVHYSSHGEVEKEGGLFLLTHDTKRDDMKDTAISGFKLRDLLGQYPSPVLLILDACHSGSFPLMKPATDSLSRLLADDSCGVAVLTAALAHQKAIDTEQGGVFTQAIVAGLSGKARPDEESKKLYVHHLFTYVFDAVARKTDHKQMPLYLPSGSVPPIVLKEADGK